MTAGISHEDVLKLRNSAQDDEREVREQVIEQRRFLNEKWGQWEDSIRAQFAGRPRYTFDKTSPAVNSIASAFDKREFGGSVIAIGGEEELAETFEGMIRTIQNLSKAQKTYKKAGKNAVRCGFDAWRLITDYADTDGFDQDILIDPIPDAVNRVWIPGIAQETSIRDRKNGFVDTFLSREDYKKQFPKGSEQSVSEFDVSGRDRAQEKDGIVVSDWYYIEEEEVLLHQLSNGEVIRDDKYQKVGQALEQAGNGSIATRTRKVPVCYMRKLDNGGWLTEPMRLPFNVVPIFVVMGNYEVQDNCPVYYGETRRLMDPARIYNYATSREVEDGALSPVEKIVVTNKHIEGKAKQLSKINTSNDPFLRLNPDERPGAWNPYKLPPRQPNPSLNNTALRASEDIKDISRSHNPTQGEAISGHSGKAYEVLNEKSNESAEEYIDAVENTVQECTEAIIYAIPIVYDKRERQVALTGEDGSVKFEQVNMEVYDPKTREMLTVRDLSQGHYSFTVSSGPAYNSRKAKTVDVITNWATIDPSLVQENGDIVYGSMQEPGMSLIAERKRKAAIEAGQIPESQLTDKEREKILEQMQAQQNQPPNPLDQATVAAIMAEVQNLQSQAEERQSKMQIDMLEQQRKMFETMMKAEKQEADIQKVQSETLENLKEATGADAIVSPSVAVAYNDVAQDIATDEPSLQRPN